MRIIKKGFLSPILFFFLACLSVGMAFLIPSITFAAEVAELEGKTSIPQYVSYILNTIMLSAGALSILVITLGGLYWMVSLGISKVTNEGKEWVKAGVLGLVLITCSYLIIMTINPKIFSFGDTKFLFIPIPIINLTNPTPIKSVPTISFDEIPIGTMTESLMTRSIDCYDFNGSGEPIDGDLSTSNIWEPTLIKHERIDCIVKLTKAAEIKAKIFSSLSEKIIEIMERCQCSGGPGNCILGQCSCSYKGPSTSLTKCEPDYMVNTSTRCNTDCDTTPCTGGDCCSAEDKKQIEEGPIILEPIDGCTAPPSPEKYWGLNEFRTKSTNDSDIIINIEELIQDKNITVIKKSVWEKDFNAKKGLRLIDKIKYFKEKIKQIQESIDKDLTNLKNAKNKLNTNPYCYFSNSAVKFLIDSASTNNNILNVTINNSYTDQITKKPVDNSKYCEGFGYSNSSCFYYCQNMCNPISEAGRNCFKGCSTNDKNCLSNCIDNQSCISNSDFTGNFNVCIAFCRGDKGYCSKSCEKKYSTCPTELAKCRTQCKTDSESLINNKNRTYLVTTDLKMCADTFSDFLQFKKCAELALQGKYCSNQNPGDPDVFKTPNNGDYSSLYFYNNQKQQKCPQCVQGVDPKTGATILGVQTYPECWKGPSCSNIPKAPCTDDACTKIDLNLLTCNSTCEKFSYSGEPLTFYCPNGESGADWITEKWQLYNDMTCKKTTEIPVGQTVDGAIAWGEKIDSHTKNFLQTVEDMVQYIKTIGDEKDYCICDSKCGDGKTACQASCLFNQTQVDIPILDDEGNPTGETTTQWLCNCYKTNCEGNPCQRMINLLRGKETDEKCPEGTEYKGVGWHHDKIETALKNFLALGLDKINSERSEVLKRLNYSREKMDDNSVKIKIAPDKILSMFSCYQVQNRRYPTIISDDVIIGNKKITGYCYGEKVSALLEIPGLLLDNWFSCQKQIQE